MEDIGGGLHPAVDGQSVDEDEEAASLYIEVSLTIGSASSSSSSAFPSFISWAHYFVWDFWVSDRFFF